MPDRIPKVAQASRLNGFQDQRWDASATLPPDEQEDSMKNEYADSGVPFLRGQNVRANRFDPKGLKFVSLEFHHSLAKSTIHGGDIAITRSGDVGIACVIPETLGEANCSDLVLIQGPIIINPSFAAYYMNSLGRRLVQKGKVGVAIQDSLFDRALRSFSSNV